MHLLEEGAYRGAFPGSRGEVIARRWIWSNPFPQRIVVPGLKGDAVKMDRTRMKRVVAVLAAIVLLAGATSPTRADDAEKAPMLENLLMTELEGAPGTEVIVSRVEIPANMSLPKHWHPGEEFAYVLEGSVTLWQEGKADTTLVQGQTGMIPLKQIHTAKTGDRGVTLLVFRVHAKGQPERVPVP